MIFCSEYYNIYIYILVYIDSSLINFINFKNLPTAKLTKTFNEEVLISGGTKYKSRLGKIEI